MTVRDLIEKLSSFNPEIEVYIPNQEGDVEYYVVHSVKAKRLTVMDDETDTVVIDFE